MDSVGVLHNELLDEFSPYLENISSYEDLITIGEPILNIGSEYQICIENMQIIGSAYRNYGMSYLSEMVDSLSSNSYIGEQASEDLLDIAELLEAKFNYIQENGSYLSSGQLDSVYDFIEDALLELENSFVNHSYDTQIEENIVLSTISVARHSFEYWSDVSVASDHPYYSYLENMNGTLKTNGKFLGAVLAGVIGNATGALIGALGGANPLTIGGMAAFSSVCAVIIYLDNV